MLMLCLNNYDLALKTTTNKLRTIIAIIRE